MSGALNQPILSLEIDDSGLTPGALAAADALNKVGDAAVATETKVGRVSATASTLVNRLDPATKSANALAAAQAALANGTDTLSRALAAGDVTQAQYNASLATLQQRVVAANTAATGGAAAHTALGTAVRGTSLSLGQILPQFEQFFSGIATGQPIFTSFIQQGHQLADQMEVTGTSIGQVASTVGGAFKSALAAVLSPLGLAIAGGALLGVGIYEVASAAQSAQERFGGLQQGLNAYGQSASAVISVSNDLAKSTGLSRSALDDLSKSLVTGIPNFQASGAALKSLETLTINFAAATGQDLQAAAGQIKSTFTDPYRLALSEMQAGMLGFNGALLTTVASLEAQGKTGEATNAVLEALAAATAHAADPTTDLGKSMRDLSTAFSTAGAGGTTLAEKLGTPFVSAMTVAIEQVAKLAAALNGAHDSGLLLANILASIPNTTPGSTTAAIAGAYLNSGSSSSAPSPILQWLTSGHYGNGSSTYTPAQIQAALINQGIPANDAAKLTAVSGAESGYGANPVGSVNPNGTTDYGVFQINSGAWPQLNPSSLPGADLNTQAAAAATVYRQQGLTAWATYNSGKYQQFMGGSSAVGTPGNVTASGGLSAAQQGQVVVAGQIKAGDGYTASLTTQQTAIQNLLAYQAQLIASNQQGSNEYRVVTEDIDKANAAYQNTRNAVGAIVQPIDDNTASLNKQAQAWAGGADAAAKAAIQQQAYIDVAKIADTSAADFGTKVQIVADALTAQANAQAAIAAAQQLSQGNDQIAYLQTEIATLGQDYDTRQKILAALQEQQSLEQSGKQYTDAQKQALIDQKVALTGYTDQLALTQSSLQEIGNFGVQAFDQIGSAITNSFESGTGAAINWGNTIRSVVGIALQELGKLVVANPLSNAIGGTNLPTIVSVGNSLFGNGTSATAASAVSGGSPFSSLSSLFQLGSAGNTLLGSPLSFSGVANSLGLSGLSGGVTGILNTPLLGSAVVGSANAATLAAQPVGFASDAANAATYGSSAGLGTTTVGGALGVVGGIGAGYGVGSLAGGYLQSALNKTGPAPEIGAGIGAGIGAFFGPVGSLAGGLLGGVAGGLIGPHPATPYTNIPISIGANGQLNLGQLLSQGEDATPDVQDAQAQQAALNALLSQSGISLVSTGGINRVGNPVQAAAPGKATDIESAFGGFGFNVNDTSTDEGKALASQVNGQSFASVAALQSVFTEVDTFVNQTLPSLTTQQTNIGSLQTTLNNLSASFTPAIAEGTKLGVGVDALTASYQKQIDAANSAVTAQAESDQTGFEASYLTAAAQVSGNPQDAQNAQLYSFDNVTAPQDRQQLITEYQGIFGDAYATTEQYVDSSAALEKSLGEQRLAIQSQYNTQLTSSATQAVGASITSLQSYIQKLQGSADSPLSAQAQYALAQSQFQAVAGAADAGDTNSIGSLPTYGDALLSASRAVNGSGIGYAQDYNSVLSSVSSVVNLGANTLTQAFMQAAMQSQTDAIIASQAQIIAAIAGLQSALTTASMQPSRIAA